MRRRSPASELSVKLSGLERAGNAVRAYLWEAQTTPHAHDLPSSGDPDRTFL